MYKQEPIWYQQVLLQLIAESGSDGDFHINTRISHELIGPAQHPWQQRQDKFQRTAEISRQYEW